MSSQTLDRLLNYIVAEVKVILLSIHFTQLPIFSNIPSERTQNWTQNFDLTSHLHHETEVYAFTEYEQYTICSVAEILCWRRVCRGYANHWRMSTLRKPNAYLVIILVCYEVLSFSFGVHVRVWWYLSITACVSYSVPDSFVLCLLPFPRVGVHVSHSSTWILSDMDVNAEKSPLKKKRKEIYPFTSREPRNPKEASCLSMPLTPASQTDIIISRICQVLTFLMLRSFSPSAPCEEILCCWE